MLYPQHSIHVCGKTECLRRGHEGKVRACHEYRLTVDRQVLSESSGSPIASVVAERDHTVAATDGTV